jgi:hypothetical protein
MRCGAPILASRSSSRPCRQRLRTLRRGLPSAGPARRTTASLSMSSRAASAASAFCTSLSLDAVRWPSSFSDRPSSWSISSKSRRLSSACATFRRHTSAQHVGQNATTSRSFASIDPARSPSASRGSPHTGKLPSLGTRCAQRSSPSSRQSPSPRESSRECRSGQSESLLMLPSPCARRPPRGRAAASAPRSR